MNGDEIIYISHIKTDQNTIAVVNNFKLWTS